MRWWESDKTNKIVTNDDELLIAEEDNSVLKYEIPITTAGLVNIGSLHSSYNPTEESRFVITIALFDMNHQRILWDDAVNILSPYIVS